MKQALVVGGIPDFIERSVGPRLRTFGLEPAWHWGMDSATRQFARDIPKDCEVVVLLHEMIPRGHALSDVLRDQAKLRGIPCVSASRKLAAMVQQLELQGFKQSSPTPDEESPVSQPVRIQPALSPSSPAMAIRSLDACKVELVRVLRELRDNHHVSSVQWDAQAKTLQMELKAEILEEV